RNFRRPFLHPRIAADPASCSIARFWCARGMTGALAGVVGWPVAQSLSPAIHGYWLKEYRIDGAYVALPIEPENFESCITALILMSVAGVNVTVPHKRAAAALSWQLDEDANAIGAVNMLTFRSDGFSGSNTDVA